jgi:hypothetical protein
MECARGVAGIMMGAMACQKAAAPVEAGGFAGGEVIKEGASCSSMHFTLPLWRVSASPGRMPLTDAACSPASLHWQP